MNEILFNSQDYEQYNSLVYDEEENLDPIARAFEVKLIDLGLDWSSTEGSVFIQRNTDYLKDKFSQFWSEGMEKFMHMYSIENDKMYANDGGISIPLNDMVDRVVYWEKFNCNFPDFVLSNHVSSAVREYTYFLLNGMDNTPAFGYDESETFSSDFKDTYHYTLRKYPDTDFGAIVKEYLKLLDESQFQRNDRIDDFLKNYSIY